MSTPCYLVLIETAGNQGFIFGTNKLKENVGASELTFRGGVTYVLNAVKAVGGPELLAGCVDQEETLVNADALQRNLLDSTRNPPLERSALAIEVIVATSGKALLIARDEATANDIVSRTTKMAVCKAPGLDLKGAMVEFDFNKPQSIHDAIARVHRRHAALSNSVPGPRERFARLAVVEGCATSGLPASMMGADGPDRSIPISAVTKAKRESADQGWERILRTLGVVNTDDERQLRLAPGPDVFDKMHLDWSAVIHADGNGFGQVFLSFPVYLPGGSTGYENRTYVDTLRRFSVGLDRCTRGAFRYALEALARRVRWTTKKKRDFLPVVPIVLGGDDLTVVSDGQHAPQLARDYLRQFEVEAERLWDEVGLVRPAEGMRRFSACAGVAIIKPHYPFYAAYNLSEELLKSAKEVKHHEPGASALDFHILYDASGYDLHVIRDRLRTKDTRLFARPYVVSTAGSTPSDWVSKRRIETLERRIVRMRARDEDGRRMLPNGMLHELREALFLGTDAAAARLALSKGRYGQALGELLQDLRGELYFLDEDNSSVTPFLDALDLLEFWAEEGQS